MAQRQSEGDAAFIEGVGIMGFLATLVGLTSVERFIPLATHETERRDVLTAKPGAPVVKPAVDTSRSRAPPAPRERESTSRTAENRKAIEAGARTGEHRRTAETTRQMPVLPNSKVYRMLAAQRAGVPLKPPAAAPPPAPVAKRRDPTRPATIKPKKPPSTVTQMEHVVIADAVRLLGWGRQWHELAEMISRLAERPAPSEIRRILRTYRDQIDAVAKRRGE